MSFPLRPCLFAAITSLGLAWGCSLNGQGEIPGGSEVSDPGPGVGNPNDDGSMTPGMEPPNGLGGTGNIPDPVQQGGAAASGGSTASGGAGFGGAAAGGAGGAAPGGSGGAEAGDAGPAVNTFPDAGQDPDAGDDITHDGFSEPPCDAGTCDTGAP